MMLMLMIRESFVQARKQTDGFTLLEVLVSMTILAIIMVIIVSAFHLGYRSWERGERDIENLQRYRVGLELLVKDLSSAYNYRTRVSNQWITLYVGKPEKVLFVSTLSVGFHQGIELGYRQVEYYVSDGGSDEERGLVRREYPITNDLPFDEENGQEILILPWVKSVQFEYLYRPPVRRNESFADVEDQWVDYWGGVAGDSVDDLRLALDPGMDPEISRQSRRFLPNAVRVTLTMENNPLKIGETTSNEIEPLTVPIQGQGVFR